MQTTVEARGASIMPKILEISVGSQMERSVSVPSDWNICDHLWRWSTLTSPTARTEICRSILTNLFVALLLFTYVGNSEKEQQMVRAIPLG